MKTLLSNFFLSLILLSACSVDNDNNLIKQDSCIKKASIDSFDKNDIRDSYYSIEGLEYTDHNGKNFQLSSLKGNFVLASMIFTHCLYACPKTTENIIQLEKLIERPIKVVLVSFDPKRDTPDRMKSFLQKNNSSANWFLLTSHQDIIKRTSMLFDISFKELETGEFSHENIILLLDKKGREIKRIEGLSFNLHQEASEIIQLMDN